MGVRIDAEEPFKRDKRKNGGIRLYVLREIRSDMRAHE